MSLESDVKRMAGTRPFSLLPREALQLIAFSCEKRTLKAGQPLFGEGDAADCAYLVLSGEIALTANGETRRASAGALIGETALLADVTRGASASARGEASLLRVPRETFRRVLGEFPQGAAKVRAYVEKRTRALIAELEAVRASGFEG